MKNFYCLSCHVSKEQKEIVLGVCYSIGMLGCEEKEYEKEILLQCYFNHRQAAEKTKRNVVQFFPSPQIIITQIDTQDWNAKWRESIEPILIADTIWISPKWLKPRLEEGEYWIKIEPKMAFGTGDHETTRLAAQALLSISNSEKKSSSLLDIGTGSGILCFVGNYQGYKRSIGIEIDPDCVNNLIENRRDNKINGQVLFVIGTIKAIKSRTKFDTIVMNMIRTHSEPLLDRCRELLHNGGDLVWSGILCEEKDSVIEHAGEKGWRVYNEITEDEWWCGTFKKSV